MSSVSIKNQIYHGSNDRESLYDLVIPNKWNGKTILFMHGYMGYKDWGCWNLVQDWFTAKGYAFCKFNVSHNGGTVEQPIDFPDLEAFAENNYWSEHIDLSSMIRELYNEHQMNNIHLIGHSRGGGMVLLTQASKIVKSVTTWAGIADIKSRFPKGKELENWKSDGVYFRENGRTKQQMPHSYSQYKAFLEHEHQLSIENTCKSLTKPVLHIHGSADTSVPVSEGESLAGWTKTKLQIINDANHTFGASQPWIEKSLPSHLEECCIITEAFINLH